MDSLWGAFMSIMESALDSTSIVAEFASKATFKKNLAVSVAEYNKGKEALKKNNFNEALQLFNEALHAVPGNSKNIASYYIARSISLQKLEAYPESLDDINKALKREFTDEGREKLLKRKKKIESRLLARDLENVNLAEEEELSYGESEEIIGASSALTLAHNEMFGRHFIANRDIKNGDILMIQKPFVHVSRSFLRPDDFESTISEKRDWICDNCLKISINPVFCDSCLTTNYCTEKCKLEASEKFHKIECQIYQVFPVYKFLLPIRLLMIITNQGENLQGAFNHLVQVNDYQDKRKGGFNADEKVDGSKAEALFSLLHNVHMPGNEKKDDRYIIALIINILRKKTDFFKVSSHDDANNSEILTKLAKLLFHLHSICSINLYSIKGNYTYSQPSIAMFPVLNYLNPSCSNNAVCNDRMGRKILRACKDIKKGEQVSVSCFSIKYQIEKSFFEWKNNFLDRFENFECHCE